jgi:hypothetical protein
MDDQSKTTAADKPCGECRWCFAFALAVGVALYGSLAAMALVLGNGAGRLAGWW